MVSRLIKRITVGLWCALMLVALAVVVQGVQAAPRQQDAPTVEGSDECVGCHDGLRAFWEESAHGQALDDPVFQEALQGAENPDECLRCHTTGFEPATGEWRHDGVECTACHYPVVGNHPDRFMPTDVSSRLCGTCHLDTYAEWQQSTHAAEDMACGQCHNPHTTNLRAGQTQEICQGCHEEEGHYYSYTGHAENGLLCTDCHLSISDTTMGEGHGQRLHTFEVALSTCNECHEQDMHTAGESTPSALLQSDVTCYREDAMPEQEEVQAGLSEEPPGISPLMLAFPAGFGLVFGALLAPWVEGWFRRRREGK